MINYKDTLDDVYLWKEFKNSDRKAFGLIYNQYNYTLLQYGKKLGADSMVVQDAIHDLFVDLWKMRQNLAEEVAVPYYLCRSLRRRLHLQQKGAMSAVDDQLELSLFSVCHESEIINREISERQSQFLTSALCLLSKREREVVQLRFFQNKSVREVGELLSIREQTVRNLMQRALIKIRSRVPTSLLD
ncbi:RNA polymerase sigma factor [Telluribacter humicola]|uniref:RNA polymerase sigma factor n=1 Tax=Telluribacter humicola TaxID=1720261 RepID=UPI001A975EC1|nr:sigma-70 family RNA polymerase sigma factor [Telluribacter humicola]